MARAAAGSIEKHSHSAIVDQGDEQVSRKGSIRPGLEIEPHICTSPSVLKGASTTRLFWYPSNRPSGTGAFKGPEAMSQRVAAAPCRPAFSARNPPATQAARELPSRRLTP